MRYLRHRETDKAVAVKDDDDVKFYELLAERLDDGTKAWVQTGAHDPAVQMIEVPGQDPKNGERELTTTEAVGSPAGAEASKNVIAREAAAEKAATAKS